jgi:ornithine--oxo-acid transaminase
MDRCIVHSTTFGRNNLACACGLATMTVLEDENLVDNAAKMGAYLEKQLLILQKKYDIIKEVRVKGLMCAIEFAEPSGFMPRWAGNWSTRSTPACSRSSSSRRC